MKNDESKYKEYLEQKRLLNIMAKERIDSGMPLTDKAILDVSRKVDELFLAVMNNINDDK